MIFLGFTQFLYFSIISVDKFMQIIQLNVRYRFDIKF